MRFRADVDCDGEAVLQTQRRTAKGVAGRKSGTPLLSYQRERNALREPLTPGSTPAGGTRPNTANAAGCRAGRLSDSASVATVGEGGRGEGGGEVGNAVCHARSPPSKSESLFLTNVTATGKGGPTHGPTNPATTPNASIQQDERNLLRILVATPSPNILRPSRVEHPIAGTADRADLVRQGVDRALKGGRRRLSSGRRTLQLPVAVASASVDEDSSLPCRSGGQPPAACEAENPTAARLSTLEMMSAMTNMPPLGPPECVTGLEIRIRPKESRPTSAPPRRLRSTTCLTSRCSVGCDQDNHEVPSGAVVHNQPCVRAPGGTFQGVAKPCNPSISFCSRPESEGEAVGISQALRNVATPHLFSSEVGGENGGVGAGGIERPRAACCIDDLQLYLKEPPGKRPGSCGERYRGNADARLDQIPPIDTAGGEEEGTGEGGYAENFGGEQLPMGTPFSRWAELR